MWVLLTNPGCHISIVESITNQQAIAHLITLNINNHALNATNINIHILDYKYANNVTNLFKATHF